jgi:hypothetical protein
MLRSTRNNTAAPRVDHRLKSNLSLPQIVKPNTFGRNSIDRYQPKGKNGPNNKSSDFGNMLNKNNCAPSSMRKEVSNNIKVVSNVKPSQANLNNLNAANEVAVKARVGQNS